MTEIATPCLVYTCGLSIVKVKVFKDILYREGAQERGGSQAERKTHRDIDDTGLVFSHVYHTSKAGTEIAHPNKFSMNMVSFLSFTEEQIYNQNRISYVSLKSHSRKRLHGILEVSLQLGNSVLVKAG